MNLFKILLVAVLAIIACEGLFGQKPAVDFNISKNWVSVGQEAISNDGNYISYYEKNQLPDKRKLVIQSTVNNWKKEITDAKEANFSNDSKMLFFETEKDSLCMIMLGTDDKRFISEVSRYSLYSDWLIYETVGQVRESVFHNLKNGRNLKYYSLFWYRFAENGEGLILYSNKENNQGSIQWLDILSGEIRDIWVGRQTQEKADGFSVDANSGALAFIVEKRIDSSTVHEIWYYKRGMDSADMIINNQTAGIGRGLAIENQPPVFNKGGDMIYFGMSKSKIVKSKPEATQVDVWSYTDIEIQSSQLKEQKNRNSNETGIYSLPEKKLKSILGVDEEIFAVRDDMVLLRNSPTGYLGSFENDWNIQSRPSYYILSLKDSSRKLFLEHPQIRPGISPTGRWVIYYDSKNRNFISYEISTGNSYNISKDANINWDNEEDDHAIHSLNWSPWQNTWLANDEAVLINDTYDIWQVDPTGKKSPINLTNYYGRKHKIKLQLVYTGDKLQYQSIEKQSSLLLRAVNKVNKDRGFYSMTLGSVGNPELLSMGPYVYDNWSGEGSGEDDYEFSPVKAKYADAYLVYRETATSKPNLFFTYDFMNYVKLTDFQPQKRYNWLTTELVSWKKFDGIMSTGLLYKPENFDSTKKYPLIIHYYEKRSDELNIFISPGYFGNAINIPWFVSHEYLVFVPDIDYKTGHPGESAYNSVVSGALWLSKKSWVDRKKIGLQGHSFGGYETNYIITRSHVFVAACSASGLSDLISSYGSDTRGTYLMYWAENGQGRMGSTPWQCQSDFINNSPIFKVDRITTPLLLMSNKNDGVVPFTQGLQFFLALRRMGKKVWMLQYDNGGHSTYDEKDYSIRVIQFFDHYLKDTPAPIWMTRGIPANLKGIDDGLELDKEIKTPGPGLVN